jgi:5'-3' exonuclease
MGIPNFLPHVEKTAGRLVDLREYKGRRIAIDLSDWIQRECHANSDMLADENHLSNFGRAILLDQQQQQQQQQQERHDDDDDDAELKHQHRKEEAIQKYLQKVSNSVVDDLVNFQQATESQIVVVLDGATPPIKETTVKSRKRKRDEELDERDRPLDVTGDMSGLERRFRANRRAGAGDHFLQVVDVIVESLRSQKIPFLVAPYEADGQLAYLQLCGYVDLVVTNDSDLIVYGPLSPVLYKIARDEEKHWTRGIIIRRSDLGAIVPGTKPSALSLMDLSPAMLAVFFTACGGDYCRKLPGIGVKTVSTAMSELFLRKTKPEVDAQHPLGRMVQRMIEHCWESKTMSMNDKLQYERDFIAAVFTYRHAIVYDPKRGKCCNMTPLNRPDIELVGYAPYQELLANANHQHDSVIGKSLPPDIATFIAEGWICPRRMILRQAKATPDAVNVALQTYKPSNGDQQEEAMFDGIAVDEPLVEDAADGPSISQSILCNDGVASNRDEMEQGTAPSNDRMVISEVNHQELIMRNSSDDEDDGNVMVTQEL